MIQTLHSQLVAIVLMDFYRWQSSLEKPQFDIFYAKR